VTRRLGTTLKFLSAFLCAGLVGFWATVALSGGLPEHDSPSARPAPAKTVRVQIMSAILQRAGTPSGRRRDRARLSLHVRVTNDLPSRVRDLNPILLARQRVPPDPHARDTTGSLLRPIMPGATAGGRLRFETAGSVTRQLISTQQARLLIAGQLVVVDLKLGTLAR
jgi:hypothetical protein